MHSGGKDSLLSTELLKKNGIPFDAWHMSTTGAYPPVLDMLGVDVIASKRSIDLEGIKRDREDGWICHDTGSTFGKENSCSVERVFGR